MAGEITSGTPELDGLTNSNQDHSAPYHGFYAERSVRTDAKSPLQRASYWNILEYGVEC